MSYRTVIENAKDHHHELLFLENHDIGPEDAKCISGAIVSSEFTTLNLNYNCLGCEGIKHIAEALKSSQIATLKIRSNDIKDDGAIYLADALRDSQVTELDIRENDIENEIVQYLHDVLVGTKLRKLHVDVCSTEYLERSMHQITNFENDAVKSVEMTLLDNNISVSAAQYINETCRKYPLAHLRLSREELTIDDVLYLSLAFKDVRVMMLEIKVDHVLQAHGIQYLVYAFKASRIYKLYVHLYDVPQQWLDGTCVRRLMDFLKEVPVLHLDLASRIIRDDNLRDIALSLSSTDLMYLDLRDNSIGSRGVGYLARALKKSKLLRINLSRNKIDDEGAKFLADGLPQSQVTRINLEKNCVESAGRRRLEEMIGAAGGRDDDGPDRCSTSSEVHPPEERGGARTLGARLCRLFVELTVLNASSGEFEFVPPGPSTHLDDYVFLMRNLRDIPNSKAHIVDALCRDHSGDYFDFETMRKVEDFVETLSTKFGTFVDGELLTLMRRFGDYDYVGLVKELERLGLHEAVKNLLFHRVLYYVDENREILHPFIYKMLHEYDMPLYCKRMEPDKRAKIISYFRRNCDLDDCIQEIIDLLGSEAFA